MHPSRPTRGGGTGGAPCGEFAPLRDAYSPDERPSGEVPTKGVEQFRVRRVFEGLHGDLREGQAPDARLTSEVCKEGWKCALRCPGGGRNREGFPAPSPGRPRRITELKPPAGLRALPEPD